MLPIVTPGYSCLCLAEAEEIVRSHFLGVILPFLAHGPDLALTIPLELDASRWLLKPVAQSDLPGTVDYRFVDGGRRFKCCGFLSLIGQENRKFQPVSLKRIAVIWG